MGLASGETEADFEHITILCREMKICSEFLHCTHQEFKRLDFEESLKWYLYDEMERSREAFFAKKSKLQHQEGMKQQDNKHKQARSWRKL